MLAAAHDPANQRLVTGGEDGKVFAVKADGTAVELGGAGKKWITSIAAGPQGAVAYGAGRSAFVRLADGTVQVRIRRRMQSVAEPLTCKGRPDQLVPAFTLDSIA